jgi:uncharacterized integral membrane protein
VWLKIKAWTKGIVFGAVLIYVAVFVYHNGKQTVHFWWWFGPTHTRDIDSIFLAMGSFVAGAVCWMLIGTTWRTMRQMREARVARQATQRPAAVAVAPATGAPAYTVRVDELGK